MGQAQSPFSSFGIGDVYGNALSNNQGMGGIGIGTPTFFNINNQNPAMLSFEAYTTPVMVEAGIMGESKRISNQSISQKASGANLSYLIMSFPIRPKDVTKLRRWTTAIGLMPYSNADFRLEYNQNIEGSTSTAHITEEGTGGFSQVFWSNGYQLGKGISIGLKSAYVFSGIQKSYSNYVNEDVSTTYIASISEKLNVKDFQFTAGVSYIKDSISSKDYRVSLGAIYGFDTNLKGTLKSKFSRLDFGSFIIDSLTLSTQHGDVYIPTNIGFGASFGKKYNWTVGVDFMMQDWSTFTSINGEKDPNLDVSWTLAMGAELTPDPYSANLFKRMNYRAGFSTEKLPFLVNGQEVKDFGINFGFSIPTGQSTMNLAFRTGKRGDKSVNLEENYFKVYFGLTLSDNTWFKRRKFD